MAKLGGTKGRLVLTGVAVLVALAAFPVVAGTASASPAPLTAASSPSNPWAYGGVGWSNGSVIVGNSELTWNASFGWTVIFTETNTSATTVQLEEQRTVGIDLSATLTSPNVSATYSYHGQETDLAFANLTNASQVYENGVAVPAIGLMNDSTNSAGSLAESISVTDHGATKSASLDVTATASTSATFSPALGLVPLNLSSARSWNSTADVVPTASWNISYSWTNDGFGGTSGTGTHSVNGTLSTPGAVTLTGYDLTGTDGVPAFADHVPRYAIVLIVAGPLGNYDGFVLVPHGFGLFSGATPPYASESLGAASISAQTLYLSEGPRGPAVTAGATTFGASTSAVSTLEASSESGVAPAAASSPGATVIGSPMSVDQARAENQCLTGGCTSATGPIFGVGAIVVIAGVVIVAAVGTVAAIAWSARRRSRPGPVREYGVPPAVAVPPPSSPTAPPASGPSAPPEPPRQS